MNPSPISSNPNMQAPLAPVVSTTPSPSLSPLSKKPIMNKRRKNLILGVIGFFLIIVGGIATYVISQRSQDLRQRATTAQGESTTTRACTTAADCEYNEVCWDNNGSLGGKYCVKNDLHTQCTTTDDCLRAYSTANGEYVYGTQAPDRLVCNTRSSFCSIERFVGSPEACKLRGYAGNLNCNNAWTDYCDGNSCFSRASLQSGLGIKINNVAKDYAAETEVAPGTPVTIELELRGGWAEGSEKPTVQQTKIFISPTEPAEQWLQAPNQASGNGLTSLTWTPSAADAGKTFWVVANSFVQSFDGKKYSYSGNPWCTKAKCGQGWQGDMPWSRTKIKVTGAITGALSCTNMTISPSGKNLTIDSPITLSSGGTGGTVEKYLYKFYNLDNQELGFPKGDGATNPRVIKNGGYELIVESDTPDALIQSSLFDANDDNRKTSDDATQFGRPPVNIQVNAFLRSGNGTSNPVPVCVKQFSVQPTCTLYYKVGNNQRTMIKDNGGVDASADIVTVTSGTNIVFDATGSGDHKTTVAIRDITKTEANRGDLWSPKQESPNSKTATLSWTAPTTPGTYWVACNNQRRPGTRDYACTGSPIDKAPNANWGFDCGGRDVMKVVVTASADANTLSYSDVAITPAGPTTQTNNATLSCGTVSGATSYEFQIIRPGTTTPEKINPSAAGSRTSVQFSTPDYGAMTIQCRPCVGTSCKQWETLSPTSKATKSINITVAITASDFSNLIATPSAVKADFSFQHTSDNIRDQIREYVIDLSTSSTMVANQTKSNIVRSSTKPLSVSNPSSVWSTYGCGKDLYWRAGIRFSGNSRAPGPTTTIYSAIQGPIRFECAAATPAPASVSVTPDSLFTVTNNAYISCATAAGATRYQFQLKRPNGSFAKLDAQAAPLATRSAIFNTFDPGVYEYRCRPCTGTGTGDTGCVAWDALSANRGTKSFTSVIPYTAVSISPTQPTTSTTNAVLSCSSVNGATRYQFQVKRPGATAYERIASDSAVATRSAAFATNTAGVYEYSCRPCYGTGLSDANCKEPWQAYRGSAPLSIATKQVTVGFTYPTVSISPETLNTATTNAKITCGQVPGAVRYEFLYTLENSQQMVAVNPSAAGSRESVTFATPTAGNLIYSCRPCSGTPASTCLGWQVFSDTSTATKKIAVATFTAATPTPAPLPTPITQIVEVPVVTERIVQVPVVTERVVTQPPTQTRPPATAAPVAAAPVAAAPVAPTESGSEEAPAPTPSELPKAGTVAGTSTAIGVGAILSVLGVIAFLLL